MAAKLIKGGEVSKQIREEIVKEIADLKDKHGVSPGLATILVGDDPGSKVYVGQKEKACNNLGIYSERMDLSADTPRRRRVQHLLFHR